MKKNIVVCTLAAAALLAMPASTQAVIAPPHASFKAPTEQFHGRITAVNAAAHTITVGLRVINVSSVAPIDIRGQAASLKDLHPGQFISLAYKTDPRGRMFAMAVHIQSRLKKPHGLIR